MLVVIRVHAAANKPKLQATFDFTPLQNSYVYAGVAAYILVLTFVCIALSSKISDRSFVLVGIKPLCVCERERDREREGGRERTEPPPP